MNSVNQDKHKFQTRRGPRIDYWRSLGPLGIDPEIKVRQGTKKNRGFVKGKGYEREDLETEGPARHRHESVIKPLLMVSYTGFSPILQPWSSSGEVRVAVARVKPVSGSQKQPVSSLSLVQIARKKKPEGT